MEETTAGEKTRTVRDASSAQASAVGEGGGSGKAIVELTGAGGEDEDDIPSTIDTEAVMKNCRLQPQTCLSAVARQMRMLLTEGGGDEYVGMLSGGEEVRR